VWQVQLAKGVIVDLSPEVIVDRRVTQKVLEQYFAKVPFLPESVETHLRLAEACMSQRLENFGNLHYQRVLDFDPENKTARTALNHRKIDEEWISNDELMLRQGYVKNKQGNWTTPQKLLIDEHQVKFGQEHREATRIVQNLVAQLTANPSREAENAFANLTDPGAVPALADALKNEQNPGFRDIYVQALARIGTGSAFYEIAQWAMRETDEKVGRTCVLLMQKSPGLSKFFVANLTSQNNTTVNRAAYILGQLNDRSTVPALINALITQHEVTIGRTNPSLAGYTGTGNNSYAGQQALKTKNETVHISNPEVLEALRKLSDQNFGYEVHVWWDWWTEQNLLADFDARRGSHD
jgi:hypothetical protein